MKLFRIKRKEFKPAKIPLPILTQNRILKVVREINLMIVKIHLRIIIKRKLTKEVKENHIR